MSEAVLLVGTKKGLWIGRSDDELVGNAYDSDKPHVPHTLREAREAFASSEVARAALGEEVVEHYVNMADVELKAFDSAVTDWELERTFERM